MWHLWVEHSRDRRVGEGWYIYGVAVGKPRMHWGPFPDQAAAEAHLARLYALPEEATPR
jgi:hypothetical protein